MTKNDLWVFDNDEFGDIRVVVVDGEPYFVGVDVAKALGYKKPTGAITANVDNEDSLRKGVLDTRGVEQATIVINESGLYSLIFGSKLPSAKKFKRWVTSEVLPAIRKTGKYEPKTPAVQQPKTAREWGIALLKANEETNQRIDKVEKDLNDLKDDLPLFPAEAEWVTRSVKKKGLAILGGKDAPAYHDRGTTHA